MIGARCVRRSVTVLLVFGFVLTAGRTPTGLLAARVSFKDSTNAKNPWSTLVAQAETLGLPTRFLRRISPDFVRVEFADLRTFAAEYHPEGHRMVLNLPLSFNSAGGVLRPLARMPHREVGTLYHELFHAYLDYLGSTPDPAVADPDGARLLAFAREQQCRYQLVSITPIVQRKSVTETRMLSERESWEALNETWAVFVGWAIWTGLEVHGGRSGRGQGHVTATRAWLKRLKEADANGDLIGYYEPEDPAERLMSQKRYLAPSHRISPGEVAMLLEVVFEEPADEARRSAATMVPSELAPGGCPS